MILPSHYIEPSDNILMSNIYDDSYETHKEYVIFHVHSNITDPSYYIILDTNTADIYRAKKYNNETRIDLNSNMKKMNINPVIICHSIHIADNTSRYYLTVPLNMRQQFYRIWLRHKIKSVGIVNFSFSNDDSRSFMELHINDPNDVVLFEFYFSQYLDL